jgi:peptidoglycan hydrolase-like protein with peptidoglycan-binding domain
VSWWDWQEASSKSWNAVGGPLDPFTGPPPPTDYALLAKGSKGDLVLWAQEHLRAAGQAPPVSGKFDTATQDAVVSFQTASALPVTGKIDTATWDALLRYSPGSTGTAKVRAARGGRNGPASAQLRSKRDEISPPGER